MKNQRAILITGASTGIGRQCALDLAEAGYIIFAGVRKSYEPFPESINIHPITLDITKTEDIQNAVERIQLYLEGNPPAKFYALINNAGIALGGPLEFLNLDEIREQFEINVFGQIACIQQFIPLLREYGAGARIINMSSIAGRSYLPFASSYSASKHALEAFSDALRVELSPWNIYVTLIEPGVIRTPIWQKAVATVKKSIANFPQEAMRYYGQYLSAIDQHLEKGQNKGLPPEVVSQIILQAIRSQVPKHRYLIGKDAKLRVLLNRLPTSILDQLMQWYLSRKLKKPA